MKNIINRLLTERKDAKAQRVYLTTESTKGTEVFRISCFRHLETTPFCPADIFDFPLRAVDLFDIPHEGARSYRRMGIIAIIFSAPASPLSLHGERVGDLLQLDELLRIKGSLFCFFRRRKQENTTCVGVGK